MLPVIRASAVHRLQRGSAAERPSSAFEDTMFETAQSPRDQCSREQRPRLGPPLLVEEIHFIEGIPCVRAAALLSRNWSGEWGADEKTERGTANGYGAKEDSERATEAPNPKLGGYYIEDMETTRNVEPLPLM
jgi:hypothetical protein